MLRLLLLLLITGSSFALPDSLHLVYEQVGKTTQRLEVSLDKGKATLTVTRDAKSTVTENWTGAEALSSEIDKSKIFEWKPQTGPGAPDFGEVRLSVEITTASRKSAAALTWNAPLRNDGPVWSLLNHLDGLMSGPPRSPLPQPSGTPAEPPPAPPAGPPSSPVPTDPPHFTPAPPSPAALPPAWPRTLAAPIPERPAPPTTPEDRIAALLASRAARLPGAPAPTAPAGSTLQVEPVQPGATEALLASLATKLPLPLAAWEPATDPATAHALATARRPAYSAALAQLNERLALRPRNAELYALRGAVRVELADLPGALADFSRAASLQPHRADHRHNRGVIQARLSNLAEARKDFEAAHRLSPARFQPAPLVLAGAAERTWLGRPGRHLRAPREDLR